MFRPLLSLTSDFGKLAVFFTTVFRHYNNFVHVFQGVCVCVVCFPTINVMLSLFIFNSNNYEHLRLVVMIGYERTDTGAVAEVN